ncbi:hypothetical protein QQS21_011078 [Conoideocrella luteorostrata]|uniref:Trichothecene 3-O-acetyltransferase-like N-terminal domain-containing protein n=1 Tax=Conoideocrella luteorostrata TaxID=1105319 RepID=A0AAJ0FNR1_9HYPO|nr:hypothetical protein QQS21_011078 [Conoideocrella luteorostrata]
MVPTAADSCQSYPIHQDVITQLPSLNGYSHGAHLFATPPATSPQTIVAELQASLDELHCKIPWLAHHVVVRGAQPGNSGFITSEPWPDSAPPNKVHHVDARAFFPSFRSLLASCGSLVESKHLVPCPGLPERHGLDLAPVLAVRAVFIDGGVFIVLSAHHSMIDGIGIMQLWDYLATLMSGGKINNQDIRIANLDRARVLPLLPPGEPVKDYNHLFRPDPWPLPPPPQTEWRMFLMSRLAAAEIKKRAAKSLASLVGATTADGGDRAASSSSSSTRISTDDALTAFCWQRISAVRLALGCVDANHVSKFGRAVNGRRAVGLGPEYLGHMMLHAATRLPIGKVASSPLGELAHQLRLDLEVSRTEWSVRSYVTFMAGVADKSKLLYGGLTNPRTDIGGTSLLPWAHRPPARMGKLGEAKMARKAEGAQMPGCMYFTSTCNDMGDIQILLCLPKAELDGLAVDAEWSRYVQLFGRRIDSAKL